MSLLHKYMFSSFSNVFFPIFLTLFTIASIVSLISIASLTSVIQINFIELLQIYSFTLPKNIFYILPVSYFISLSVCIGRVSKENELIVITSFGLSPIKILKIFLPTTILLVMILLITILGLDPKARYLKDVFLNEKEQDAQFNIEPSKYGQNLGEWFIYVEDKDNQVFKDVTLLKIEEGKDTFISSKSANMVREDGVLTFNLHQGKSFIVSETIQQIDFKKMIMSSQASSIKQVKSLRDIIEYWGDIRKNKKKQMFFNFIVLVSIFPLVLLLFTVVFGYFNPRYHSDKSISGSILVIILYIATADNVMSISQDIIIYVVPVVWVGVGFLSYFYTTRKIF